MKLVVLDGYTLQSIEKWQKYLGDLADVTAYDRTAPSQVYERIKKADMVLTNKVILPNDVLDQCLNLRYIGVLATGFNVVDTSYAAARNIVVTNIPAYSTASVVQHVFALLLTLTSHVSEHNAAVLKGEWCSCPDFTFLKTPLVELAGKTIGILGAGAIGEAVARVATAFGMKVLMYSRTQKELKVPGVIWCDLEMLLKLADVVTIHTPLTDQTHHLINQKTLQMMKPTAFLINTARGPIVCEEDLAQALNNGVIAGAAVDVVSVEPPTKDNPLFGADHIIITPHIAWATNEAKARLLSICRENIMAFLQGKPQNRVN